VTSGIGRFVALGGTRKRPGKLRSVRPPGPATSVSGPIGLSYTVQVACVRSIVLASIYMERSGGRKREVSHDITFFS
jgi:hypothetical protein